jgi:hypothetical protein
MGGVAKCPLVACDENLGRRSKAPFVFIPSESDKKYAIGQPFWPKICLAPGSSDV